MFSRFTRAARPFAGSGAFVTSGFILSIILAGACRPVLTAEREHREALRDSGAPYSRPFEERELPIVDGSSEYVDLLDRALRADPVIEAAYFRWAAAVERVVLESSPPDPTLGFGWMFTEPLGGFFDNIIILAGLATPAPAKLTAAARRALAEAAAARERFEALRFARKGVFRAAYADYDGATREWEIAQRDLTILQEIEPVLRARIATGRGTGAEIIKLQMEKLRAGDRVAAALAAIETTRAKVNALMSREAAAPLLAAERLRPVPVSASDAQLLNLALRRNPELREIQAEILARAEGIGMARAEEDPDIEFQLLREATDTKPMAMFSIPLRRDRVRAVLHEAEAAWRESLAKRRSVRNDVMAETAASIVVLREAMRRQGFLEDELLPWAQQSLQWYLQQFGAGGAEFTDVSEARRAVLEIEGGMERARVDREKAFGDLLACCGADVSEAGDGETSMLTNHPEHAVVNGGGAR